MSAFYRFWHHGEWTDVVVDDFLPVVDGKPIYLHSKDEGIFWAPLLEKAYAKLTRCYSDLENLPPLNAMVDLTEGVATSYDLLVEDSVPDDLFWKLKKKLNSKEMHNMACLSVWKKPAEEDTFDPHICSYTILGLVEVLISLLAKHFCNESLTGLCRWSRVAHKTSQDEKSSRC